MILDHPAPFRGYNFTEIYATHSTWPRRNDTTHRGRGVIISFAAIIKAAGEYKEFAFLYSLRRIKRLRIAPISPLSRKMDRQGGDVDGIGESCSARGRERAGSHQGRAQLAASGVGEEKKKAKGARDERENGTRARARQKRRNVPPNVASRTRARQVSPACETLSLSTRCCQKGKSTWVGEMGDGEVDEKTTGTLAAGRRARCRGSSQTVVSA